MAIDYLPLIDNFVSVQPGGAVRLLPFGTLVKNGKRRVITPELVRTFKLPHFRPPMKLGSHEEATPAGGFITGLEVRSDGLYALTETNEAGRAAIEAGAYRYQSPEVVWEDGALENPSDGSTIYGPLIVGMALTHTPHLGEAAALYEAEPIHKGVSQMSNANDMVSMPQSFFEKLWDRFTPRGADEGGQEPPPPAPDPTGSEQYTAVVSERDQYKAEVEALKARQSAQARVDKYAAELTETKLAGAEGAPDMLAGMTDEQAAWVLQQLKGLSAQIEAGGDTITTDVGSGGANPEANPAQQFAAAIQAARIADKELSYPDAVQKVSIEQPELYNAWVRQTKTR